MVAMVEVMVVVVVIVEVAKEVAEVERVGWMQRDRDRRREGERGRVEMVDG